MLDPNSIEYALEFFRKNFPKRKFEILHKKFIFSQDEKYYSDVGFRIVIATEHIEDNSCVINEIWDLSKQNSLVFEISGNGRFGFSHHGNRLKTIVIEIKKFMIGL